MRRGRVTPLIIRLFAAVAAVCGIASASQAGEALIRETCYRVHGATIDEMNAVIAARAPRGGAARGMGFIDFDRSFQTKSEGRTCRVFKAKVGTRVTLILPKWREGAKPVGRVTSRFNALERHIRRHEYGHVRIAERYARLMRQRLSALKSDEGCWALRRQAADTVATLLRQHQGAQQACDRRELKRVGRRR